jgi:hypothetical protein
MATPDEIRAAIAKAEAAGRTDLADKLRAYLPAEYSPERIKAAADKARAAGRQDLAAKLMAKLPAATGEESPIVVPRADPERDRQRRIDDFAAFEMANPELVGRYTPDSFPAAGEVVSGPGGGGRSGGAQITVKPSRVSAGDRTDTFGGGAAAMMEGPVDAMQAFGGGLIDTARSPSYAALEADPYMGQAPSAVNAALSKFGDLGGAALSALGAGIGGATGLAMEAVPGLSDQGEGELAQSAMLAAQFAAPELAGVSSVGARAAGAGVRAAPEAAPVARAVPSTPVASVAETVIPKAVAQTPEQIGALTAKASSGGMGAVKAQEELAAAARLNPEAKAAADRLGIDLPADVFSDSDMVKAAAGLTRSEVGKEPEAFWRRAVKDARDKADEIMAAMDGSPDIASVSESVKGALSSAQESLKKAAKTLYEKVDAAVPKGSPASVENTVKALNQVIADLGGTKGMAPAEKALFDMVTNPDQPVTYGRLLREKALIGKAIARGESPYSSLDSATLGRMYGAIAEDQLATVTALGDDATRAQLREANMLTAKQKGLEKRIVAAYGSDLDGSIGAKLRSAVVQGAKGDIAGLARIIKVIPEDLRKQAVATALTAATRSARATEPGFGLSEFAKTFGGIKANKPVYNLIGKTIGPEGMAMLDDLLTVAQRIASADSNVLRTGKANQALVAGMMADGLVGRVLKSSAGQKAVRAGASGLGFVTGGPVGGMVGGEVGVALTQGTRETLAAAGRLFASEEFKALAVKAAQGDATAVQSVARLPVFRAWAKAAGVKDVTEWLSDLKAPAAAAGAQDAANANQRPAYEALWSRY